MRIWWTSFLEAAKKQALKSKEQQTSKKLMDGHAEDARGAKYKKKSEPILVEKSQQSEFAVCSEIRMLTVFLFSSWCDSIAD